MYLYTHLLLLLALFSAALSGRVANTLLSSFALLRTQCKDAIHTGDQEIVHPLKFPNQLNRSDGIRRSLAPPE